MAPAPVIVEPPRVSAAAGDIDVLYEQFQYLLEHGDQSHPSCRECKRYAQLRKLLMEPFQERRKR